MLRQSKHVCTLELSFHNQSIFFYPPDPDLYRRLGWCHHRRPGLWGDSLRLWFDQPHRGGQHWIPVRCGRRHRPGQHRHAREPRTSTDGVLQPEGDQHDLLRWSLQQELRGVQSFGATLSRAGKLLHSHRHCSHCCIIGSLKSNCSF